LAGGEETMNEFETKQAIVAALKKFPSSPFGQEASDLLGVLGYTSKKRLALKPNTFATFLTTFSQGRSLNERYAMPNEWKSVDILFQLTDEEVRTAANAQFEFESKGAFSGAIINSYLFIAIELKGEHYSRSALAGITREVNKLFTMPALIFFRHGEAITLAVINRRLHKREPGKDVLEKVTLIQDIRLANTHRAHIEILYDLSLGALHQKYPFTNFVGLHEAWQKTLDTSELNKRFFQDLANWYFWALPQVRFPKNAPKDADSQDSLSLIRLITRVIFCWFLKEKGLLPSALFDEHKIPELLLDVNLKESTYYKAILQNLFFATLNQEMGKREFRKNNQNFMAHNVYRYRSLLKSPDDLLDLLAQIPFMNGGLFECLDKTLGTKESPQYIRIDGFSDRDDNVLKIPNSLFWGPEKVVDLSEAYGEGRYSASRVAGLVRIFDRYKFTVTENTPLDEEIALDPELLGKVFENLLAAYNPETGATARKQTGSFYTPREIVNYMVDESLIFSLGTQLKNALPKAAQVEERLRQLVAYSDEAHLFGDHEVTALIYAIDHLKILDPACGSGAFPMGILHKLVYVLAKLDPGNQRWKDRQLAKANEIPDSTVRERVVSDIEQSFNANELDYGRKLYLIENCIYGVDIQPIAVQISKLRFFISLIVEQKVNPRTENLGIRPLPNLETKFVAANTLIGITRPGQQLLRNLDIEAKELELRQVRERHFLARTPSTKAKCREQDEKLRAELAALLRSDGWDSNTAKILAVWDPYDQNASAPFFDPEWMFGMLSGFDVVIANPPYISVEKFARTPLQAEYKLRFETYASRADIYCFFYEKGLELLRDAGVLAYISSNKFQRSGYGKGLRKLLASQRIRALIDFCELPVFEAATDPMIVVLMKQAADRLSEFPVLVVKDEAEIGALRQSVASRASLYKPDQLKDDSWSLEGIQGIALVEKLRAKGTPLGQYIKGDIMAGIKTGFNKAFWIDLSLTKRFRAEDRDATKRFVRPLLVGDDARRWVTKPTSKFLIYTPRGTSAADLGPLKKHLAQFRARLEQRALDQEWFELQQAQFRYSKTYQGPKIVYPDIALEPRFSLDTGGLYPDMTAFSIPSADASLVAILNSSALWFFLCRTAAVLGDADNRGRVRCKTQYVSKLPIPSLSNADKSTLAELADRAAEVAASGNYNLLAKVEKQIDTIVYRLFDLSKDEITQIETSLANTRVRAAEDESDGEDDEE
jgi:adenine-specific DNA-methyltransferase